MVCAPCMLAAVSFASGGVAITSKQKWIIIIFSIISFLLVIWFFIKKNSCKSCKKDKNG